MLYINFIDCLLHTFYLVSKLIHSYILFGLDLITAGALPILIAIQKICNNDIEVCILLAKILSNISLHSEYLNSIYESGKIDSSNYLRFYCVCIHDINYL